jgi:hypothetical protein
MPAEPEKKKERIGFHKDKETYFPFVKGDKGDFNT